MVHLPTWADLKILESVVSPQPQCCSAHKDHICESRFCSPKFGCRVTKSISVSQIPQVHLQKALSGGWFYIASAWKKSWRDVSCLNCL